MSERAEQMARSVRAAMAGLGYPTGDEERVGEALSWAMLPRMAALDDDHHPSYLHPGRSALVLLRDVGRVEPDALLTAVLLESGDPDWAPDLAACPPGLDDVAPRVRSIPRPGSEDLAERLVALDVGTALAALAERLDHLRHLHLRDELQPTWADHHEEVTGVWMPFAARTHETLARRYAHWARSFGHRFG